MPDPVNTTIVDERENRIELLAMAGFVAVRFHGQEIFVFPVALLEKFLANAGDMLHIAKMLAAGREVDLSEATLILGEFKAPTEKGPSGGILQ